MRRREEDEASPLYRAPLERKTVRCSICGVTGHNRRNCKAHSPNMNKETPGGGGLVADHDHTQSARRKVLPPRRGAISTQVVAGSSSGAAGGNGAASGMPDRGGRIRGRGRGWSVSEGIGGRTDMGNLQHPDIASLGRQAGEQSS
uniref:CCHC-type domain-containing protein n=1 Tax=Nelumbo nucifera TaxID=4432 RepID=A0A822XQK9_NELNU|nr:TPA_asm: hypothetical protein HUJ06_023785 [Nelumbo nucifera]